MARFLHFTSFRDYEESCLDGVEKVKEIGEVDELIHNTSYNTNYDDELG